MHSIQHLQFKAEVSRTVSHTMSTKGISTGELFTHHFFCLFQNPFYRSLERLFHGLALKKTNMCVEIWLKVFVKLHSFHPKVKQGTNMMKFTVQYHQFTPLLTIIHALVVKEERREYIPILPR